MGIHPLTLAAVGGIAFVAAATGLGIYTRLNKAGLLKPKQILIINICDCPILCSCFFFLFLFVCCFCLALSIC